MKIPLGKYEFEIALRRKHDPITEKTDADFIEDAMRRFDAPVSDVCIAGVTGFLTSRVLALLVENRGTRFEKNENGLWIVMKAPVDGQCQPPCE